MNSRPPGYTSLAQASQYYIVRPCLKKYKNDYQDWVEDSKSTHFSFKGFYVNKSRTALGLFSVFSPAAGGWLPSLLSLTLESLYQDLKKTSPVPLDFDYRARVNAHILVLFRLHFLSDL